MNVAPFARPRVDGERAPVRLCERAREKEPETRTGLGAAGRAAELLEDLSLMLRRDSWAGVLDAHDDVTVVQLGVDP